MYYKIYEVKLLNHYILPNGLELDYWGDDVSKENYGVVIKDTMGGAVLNEGLYIGKSGLIVSKLNDYHLESESLIVNVIFNNKDNVNIKINENHFIQILADYSLKKDSNHVNLNDKEVID